jgi:hypothetical protein
VSVRRPCAAHRCAAFSTGGVIGFGECAVRPVAVTFPAALALLADHSNMVVVHVGSHSVVLWSTTLDVHAQGFSRRHIGT